MKTVRIPAEMDRPPGIEEVGSSWRELAAAIGGGCSYIEETTSAFLAANLMMIVDEEGAIRGDAAGLQQQLNVRASMIHQDFIYGDVLLLEIGETPQGRDLIGLSDPDATLALVTLLELLTRVVR